MRPKGFSRGLTANPSKETLGVVSISDETGLGNLSYVDPKYSYGFINKNEDKEYFKQQIDIDELN